VSASPPPPASPAEYYIKHTKSQKCLNDNERALLIECQPSIGTNRWYIEPNDNLASTQYRFKNKNNTSRYLSTDGKSVNINTTPTDWKYTDNQISYDNKYFDIESNRMLLRDPTEIDSNNRIILPIGNAINYPFIYLWTKGATPMALDYVNERFLLINTIVRNTQRFILERTSTPNVYYIIHYATGLYLNIRYTVNDKNNIIDPIVTMGGRNPANQWEFIQNTDGSYTIKAKIIIGKPPSNIGSHSLIYTKNILAFDNSPTNNTWNFVTYKNTENMWSVNASI